MKAQRHSITVAGKHRPWTVGELINVLQLMSPNIQVRMFSDMEGNGDEKKLLFVDTDKDFVCLVPSD